MSEVIRFADYERKSRNADACEPRDPNDAAQIHILPFKSPEVRVIPPTIIEAPCDVAHK